MDDHFQTPTHPYLSGAGAGAGPRPSAYALSGKIMLTAIIVLFVVIIIMICVHIYARWYIHRARRHRNRRTHLIFYIDSPHTPSKTHGLDPSVLMSLPTITFSKAEKVFDCAVCLSEFEVAEQLRLLPKCKHCFHVECIDMWFHSHSTCPLCRSPVEAEVVVELGESTQSHLGVVPETTQGDEMGPSCSFGGRRKGVDSVEVPKRSESFCYSDESGPSRSPGFKSPTSRILSFKRILSREKKSPLPSPSGAVSSCELDVELGRVDTSSQCVTPK